MKLAPRKRRVIVVTGAAAGVGCAIAREFGREGARVGLIARGRAGLEAARAEIEAMGGEALVLPLDVADDGAVSRAAAEVERTFGPIDVWVNNAMVSVFSPVSEMLPEEYRRVTEVTYLGYVYGTMAALKSMRARNQGTIIQIGSALAHRSIPLQSAYCAAKHAINGFTESLRVELLHDRSRVQVCQINLPAVNTPQFGWSKTRLARQPQPVPPIFQPEMIAGAVHYVSLHPRRVLNIAYPTIQAIWSEKISPALGDRYLAEFGYESQETSEPLPAGRRDNLWEPVDEDRGARGMFSSRAKGFSPVLWADLHRGPLALAVGGLLALGFGAAKVARRRA